MHVFGIFLVSINGKSSRICEKKSFSRVDDLADVFENFQKTSNITHKSDPCYYVGTPSFGWDTLRLRTKVKLD